MSGKVRAGLTEELLTWAGVTIHPHRHMYPVSGWVSVYLNTERDVAHAINRSFQI